MNCPLCQSDLRGDAIPAKHFEHKEECKFSRGKFDENSRCFCLPYGDRPPEDRFWGRQMLIEVSGVYDGGLFYLCPDCGEFFHRFGEYHYLHKVAELEMEKMRQEALQDN